jgi:hypothetical protein
VKRLHHRRRPGEGVEPALLEVEQRRLRLSAAGRDMRQDRLVGRAEIGLGGVEGFVDPLEQLVGQRLGSSSTG